jgi:DNA-binding XRE family transcriptional regulator
MMNRRTLSRRKIMSNKIREIRLKLGISQEQLGLKADVSPLHLGRIERGVRCNKTTAAKIAATLSEKPETVFPDFNSLRAW